MSSIGAVIALIIVFILIAVLIILSIVAMVATKKTSKRKYFAIHRFDGTGTDETFELIESAHFYYNVTTHAKLSLSGIDGIIAVIHNNSDTNITIIPIREDVFKLKRGHLNSDGSYTMMAKKSIIIIWQSGNKAKIVKI